MRKRKIKAILNNENGVALVVALLLTLVMSTMGLSLMGLATNNLKMTSGERNYQSSFYIAESGVTHVMNDINSKVEQIYNESKDETEFFDKLESELKVGSEQTYDSFEESFGQKPVATISIQSQTENNSTEREYKITSTGMINNRSRIVEKEFSIKWIPKNDNVIEIPKDKVLLVKKTVTLNNNSDIKGNIWSNSQQPKWITLNNNSSINGNIESKVQNPVAEANNSKFYGRVIINTENFPFSFPALEIPSSNTDYNLKISNNKSDTIILDDNKFFNKIEVSNNGTLNINVFGESKFLLANKLIVENNAKINITGGKLTIYIINDLNLSQNSRINSLNNIKNLNIFVKKSSPAKKITINNNAEIYGSLFAENARITLSSNAGFFGHIFTGGTNVTINGNANVKRVLYAPNADVTLENNVEFKGAIFAKSLKLENNAELKYANWDYNSLPLPAEEESTDLVQIEDLLSEGNILEKN